MMNRLILNSRMLIPRLAAAPVRLLATKANAVTDTANHKATSDKDDQILNNLYLHEFFDIEENFGKSELRPKYRPGRSWTIEELRLKSNVDLHKLWYVLLKEKNMLLTMQHAYVIRQKYFPNPERLDRVEETMENIEFVVHERNDAYCQLETGNSASPPERAVTSFSGFTYKKQAREHLLPAAETGTKEYEVPYLEDSAYITQKLWAEKQHLKAMHEADDRRHRQRQLDPDAHLHFRGDRKTINCVEQMSK